jgi:hypothetical protein
MIKLDLEKFLEAGFYAMKIPFSERQYGEDIRLGSQVDDTLTGDTVEGRKKEAKGAISNEERLVLNIFAAGELTKEQGYVFSDTVPVFRRIAEAHDIKVIYDLITGEKHDEYRPVADELISEGKADQESVEILIRDMPVVKILVGSHPNMVIPGVNPESDKAQAILGKMITNRLKDLQALHDQDYDPWKVYSAVMDFLRA